MPAATNQCILTCCAAGSGKGQFDVRTYYLVTNAVATKSNYYTDQTTEECHELKELGISYHNKRFLQAVAAQHAESILMHATSTDQVMSHFAHERIREKSLPSMYKTPNAGSYADADSNSVHCLHSNGVHLDCAKSDTLSGARVQGADLLISAATIPLI